MDLVLGRNRRLFLRSNAVGIQTLQRLRTTTFLLPANAGSWLVVLDEERTNTQQRPASSSNELENVHTYYMVNCLFNDRNRLYYDKPYGCQLPLLGRADNLDECLCADPDA